MNNKDSKNKIKKWPIVLIILLVLIIIFIVCVSLFYEPKGKNIINNQYTSSANSTETNKTTNDENIDTNKIDTNNDSNTKTKLDEDVEYIKSALELNEANVKNNINNGINLDELCSATNYKSPVEITSSLDVILYNVESDVMVACYKSNNIKTVLIIPMDYSYIKKLDFNQNSSYATMSNFILDGKKVSCARNINNELECEEY